MKYLFVGLGGFLGAISRYAFVQLLPFQSEWKIAFVNILGCFLIGCFSKVFSGNSHILFITGFIASFTTFSSLILQVSEISAVSAFYAIGVLLTQLIFGVLLFKLGLSLPIHLF